MSRSSSPIRARVVLLCGLSTWSLMAQATPPSPTHLQAAKDLYKTIGGTATSEAAANAMLSAMTSQNPQLAKYRDVLEAWFKKVFSGGDFEGEMAKVYTEYFSEKELRGLMAFYQTELGLKSIRIMPQIMQKGAMVGAQQAQAHTQELKDMLTAAMKEREPAAEEKAPEAPK